MDNIVRIKPFYWCGEDKIFEDKKRFNITIFGHNEDNNVVAANIYDFQPWLHLVMPKEVDESCAETLAAEINNTLKDKLRSVKNSDGTFEDHSPQKYEISMRYPYYYYTDKKRFCIKMHFISYDAARHCQNLLKWPVKTYNYGPVKLLPTGTKIKQLTRAQVELDIKPCEWIKIPNILAKEKLTTCKKEYRIKFNTVKQCSPNICEKLGERFPSYLVYDGEMMSHRKGAFPDELNNDDPCFMLGLLHIKYSMKEKQYLIDEYCLVYHPTLKKEDIKEEVKCSRLLYNKKTKKYSVVELNDKYVKQFWFDDEIDMISFFEKLIVELDPDGLIGHNSNSFDIKYLKVRKSRLAEKFRNLTRMKNWNQGFRNIEWYSSAYHENNLWVPDGDGRIYFDTMDMAKRDYKEDSFSLDYLSNVFLGIGKHKWLPEDMFRAFRTGNPDEMRTTIVYCMRDVWCTWGLFQHLNFWLSYSGMSSIMGVGIFDLFSRGQGIRTITLMFKECYNNGYYLFSPDRKQRSIAGGYVFPQVPGLYEWVILIDFQGLYPAILRRFNISNDTYDINNLADDKDCYILDWDDQHGHWKTRFVKPYVRKGLVPKTVESLTESRNQSKAKKAACEKAGDERGVLIYDVEQLGYKKSSNSVYGALAQKGGYLGLEEAGATVTAYGRVLIQKAAKWATEKGFKVVYGDSVTGQTPIIVYNVMLELVMIVTIEYLFNVSKIIGNEDDKEKQYRIPYEYLVWSDQGWTLIQNVMRHKTRKRIFKIVTETGYVEVTEDHSLLNNLKHEIKPKDVKIGDELLSSYPLNEYIESFSSHEVEKNKDYFEEVFYSQWVASHFYIKYKSLGYSVKFNLGKSESKRDLYVLNVYKKHNVGNDFRTSSKITKIEELQYENDIWVYDLTTQNHHFQAGIGDIIVHNTDSIMVTKVGGFTEDEKINIIDIGGKVVDQMNKDCFQYPIKMELDGVFRTMMSLKKKTYAFIEVDPENPLEINPELWKSKGLMTSRRDTCKKSRKIYKNCCVKTTALGNLNDIILEIADELDVLFNKELNTEDMTTIIKLGGPYSNKNYPMAIFQRHLHSMGMNVKPGDRLPFVYVKRDRYTHQGECFEDPKVFEDSLKTDNPMKLHRRMYLLSQLAGKLDTMLHSAFKNYIPENFIKKLPELLDARPNSPILNCLVSLMQAYQKNNNKNN